MDVIGLHFCLEALGSSPSTPGASKPSRSGRSSPISINCPDSILFTSQPGTGGRPAPTVTEECFWSVGRVLVLLVDDELPSTGVDSDGDDSAGGDLVECWRSPLISVMLVRAAGSGSTSTAIREM